MGVNAGEAEPVDRGRDERRRTILLIVVLVVASRIILSVGGLVAAEVFDDDRAATVDTVYPSVEEARQDLTELAIVHQWYNWDALHYENLSRQWLDVERPVAPNVVTTEGGRAWNEFSWPPLYPLAIALLHGVSGLEAGALMLALNLGLFGVFLFLVRCIVRVDGYSERDARAAIVVNLCAPFAFFLSSAMSEPLFVCLAAGSLLCTRHRQWVAAGLLAAAMAWTKMTGVFMVGPLAVAALIEVRRSGGHWLQRLRPVLAPAICAVAYLAYLGFAWYLTGTPRAAFLTQRHGWGNTVGNPVVNLVTNLDRWQYLVVLVLLILAVLLWRSGELGAVDATYCVLMLFSATTVVQIVGAAPRYTAVAFPIATAVALWARPRRLAPVVAGVMGGAQVVLFGIWTSYWLVQMF